MPSDGTGVCAARCRTIRYSDTSGKYSPRTLTTVPHVGDLLDVLRPPAAATRPRSPAAKYTPRRRTRIDMPSRIARVRGREIEMVVPKPARRADVDGAAHGRDIALDHIHADAAAGDVGHRFGGRESRARRSTARLRRPSIAVGLLPGRSRFAFSRMRSRFRPPPSSATSMMMLPPWWAADRNRRPVFGLAGRRAGRSAFRCRGRCELRTRWVSGSTMRSIKPLSSSVCGAIRDEIDFLAQLGGQVAHHAREAREHEVHRHHADRHHRFLQVAGVAGQLADRRPAGAGGLHRVEAVRCAARSWPG